MAGSKMVTSLCLATLIALVGSTTVTIDSGFQDCGTSYDVLTTSEFVVRGRGNGIATCHVTFVSELKDGCLGLCYNIRNDTFEKGNKVRGENSLTITTGRNIRTFKYTNPYIGAVCSRDTTLALCVTGDTAGTEEALTFDFELEVYNNCGNTTNSITFDKAVGHQYWEKMQSNEWTAYFKGLALGLGLCFIWLLLLCSAFVYMKFRPHVRRRYVADPRPMEEEKLPLTTEESGVTIDIENGTVEA